MASGDSRTLGERLSFLSRANSAPPDTAEPTEEGGIGSWFSGVSRRIGGYTPFGAEDEDESFFGLTYTQRFIGFIICSLLGAFCLFLSFFTLPMLIIRPQKFALSFTLGSLLVMISFALLRGPAAHTRHLISKERLLFTTIYFSSMGLTLFFTLAKKGYILTLLASLVQLIALIWYFMSYVPGGTTGFSYGSRAIGRSFSTILPI
ncbi:SFT2-domain-containing protein [Piptocephalis cylindrospora]|uniref:Protein transport protein SFT2 n=1 Tax=Piptocephalis cylindrospora TaxID=1907219 RepID=A0A4P9Y4R8_9FUNG|nr:SFT2-domain-containing protein [Piptocephalis cylindrospora]RKP13672.1 SFT2-domain-containing protein [Piptocephalis cylindrospora]|eukprot:RKP13669.1 SFT2-domain-containing protein [Piptocephalis cylindrospora]